MVTNIASKETAGYLLGFVGVAIFGATLPMTRLAVLEFDPWFVTMGRAALAGFAAAGVLMALRPPVPAPKQWLPLIVAAIAVTVGFPGFMAIAMETVPASHGGVVLGILPMATALAAALVAAERPTLQFWFWCILGTGLVIAYSLRHGDAAFGAGDLWLAAAGASAALGYALFGKLTRTMPSWAVISWALIIALPISLPATLVAWQPEYHSATAAAWSAFLYLAFFSMFLGFFAWNKGLALGGIAKVGQIQLLQTFITLIIAALFLGETIDTETMIFAVAVVIAVAAGRNAPVRHKN